MVSDCAGIRGADHNGMRQGQTGFRRTTKYKGRAAFRRGLGSALCNEDPITEFLAICGEGGARAAEGRPAGIYSVDRAFAAPRE